MARTEQRRYSRLATRLDARVHAPGVVLGGQVRDYCLAGLLFVPDEADLAAAADLPGGTPVEIELDGGPTLPAVVARADAAGLGLQVSTLADDAVAVLRAAAVDATAVPTAGPARAVATAARQAMQRACQRTLAASLNDTLKAFFVALPAALDAAVDTLEGLTLRSRFGGAAHRIATERAAIAARFDAALRESMRDPTRRRDAAPPDDLPPALSLVDEEQFEEWLCLSTLVNRIESDETLPLTELRRRYGALRAMPLDRATDPFGPEAILHAFQQAIAPLALPTQVGAVVYETFGVALHARCAALYGELNDVLAPLSEPLSRRLPRRPPRAKPRPAPASAEPPFPPADDIDPPTRPLTYPPLPASGHGAAAVASSGAAHGAASGAGYGAAPEASPTARAVASYGASSAMSTGAPSGPAGGVSPAPSHDAPDRVSRGVARGAVRGASAGAANGRPVPFAARDDDAARAAVSLLGLAARLRTGTDTPVDVPASPGRELSDPSALPGLLEALLAAASPVAGAAPLADASGPGISQRLTPAIGALPLAPAQRRTVESATGLLGRAMSEPDADSAIRRLLRRLEVPLLRLALGDPSFLDSPRHPGRRLVDLIEQCAIATDDRGRFEDPKLERLLERVVDRVAVEVDRDPTVLERNARLIERLLVPLREARRHRVERLQQAFEAREAVRIARQRAERAIALRFDRLPVPQPVRALLDAGWIQHLVLAEIRGGGRPDAGAPALETLERLAVALSGDPEVTADDARRMVRDEVEPVLRAIAAEPERIEACLRALEDAIAALARDGTLPDATPLTEPESDPEITDAQRVFARRLRIGDWWMMDDEDGPRAMQLVWMSTPPRACGFASRAATRRHELVLDAFAGRIESGRMRPCTDRDSPLLERSELALLDEGWRALRERAQRDPVTGLPNRRGFLAALADAVPGPRWVGLVRFDTLRMVGARCGVDAAEALIRTLVAATHEALGAGALLGRHDDDTLAFAVPAHEGCDGEAPTAELIDRLRDHPFEHGAERYRVGVHVGLARLLPDGPGLEEALGRAEAACAAALERGRNRGQVYDRGGRELRSQESLTDWAGRLDRMLEGDGLYLRVQRIEPIGADPALQPYSEVLLGIDADDGSVEPSQFVLAIERLDRSHEVDLWVMRRVFDWIDANPAAFAAIGGLAINVSPRSLDHGEMLRLLDDRLERLGADASRLIFEVTETSAIQCYGAAQDFIRRVRRYGCRVSLDDFGSGWASYAHLKNLRTDVLKIDGSFVRDIATNSDDLAMVRSMHEVARSLGMRTVAEHVESEEVLDMLRGLGIDYAQGWAIHAACRIDAIDAVDALEEPAVEGAAGA